MKDRIRMVMEDRHMTQQTFAQFIGMSPASLSSIFNGRTKPTLNIIEAIKKKIPNISTDWLLLGVGNMYDDVSGNTVSGTQDTTDVPTTTSSPSSTPMLAFDMPENEVSPSVPGMVEGAASTSHAIPQVDTMQLTETLLKLKQQEVKQRKITEIRVFYDDNTWESFSPKD